MRRALDFLKEGDASPQLPRRSATKFRSADDEPDDHPAVDDSDEDAEEEAFIALALHRRNARASAEVIKAATRGKGKQKIRSGDISGGGSFQSMGLLPALLRSLLLRGYNTPTPIQRASIPSILAQPPRDMVGMARTGSGKTLAYMIPLIHKLNARHSTSFGIKSLILCPGRELALQILKVGKDLARGSKPTDAEAIRWALIVGGESLDEQFSLMSSNPDVVIATPGRLLHLTIEMNLSLSAVRYVVFDEADRLFEMGFSDQLEELLKRLPVHRQTCIFSATLPKSLIEFARAGLGVNPKLVRLDAESKVSADLRMGFFSVKPQDKEAALLTLLRDVIGVPYGELAGNAAANQVDGNRNDSNGCKRKRLPFGKNASAPGGISGTDSLLPHQTVVFCATKHHVEYLLYLLTNVGGYACSHIYSSLDQAARSLEMKRFREGRTSLLIVTDVAARGIDLPVLKHVVNYDFTPSPRVFVHRVGRTARAGKSGWAWNIINNKDLPALCDLELFLNRPLKPPNSCNRKDKDEASGDDDESLPLDAHTALHLGTLPREILDIENEYLTITLPSIDSSVADQLQALRKVVVRAQKMYERSNGASKPSAQSLKRAKKMTDPDDEGDRWKLAGSGKEESGVSDFFLRPGIYGLQGLGPTNMAGASLRNSNKNAVTIEKARSALLAKIAGFRSAETVFEIGSRGEAAPLARLMRDRRKTLNEKQMKASAAKLAQKDSVAPQLNEEDETHDLSHYEKSQGGETGLISSTNEVEMAEEEDIDSVFDIEALSKNAQLLKTRDDSSLSRRGRSGATDDAKSRKDFRDPEFYFSYSQLDSATEKGYSIGNTGREFVSAARSVSFSLTGDDGGRFGATSQARNASRWNTKKKKFVKGDHVGADNQKMIRTESGVRLPASFRSGRFDEWAKRHKVHVGKVGDKEEPSSGLGAHRVGHALSSTHKFRHHSTKDGKRLDPLAKDYQQKIKARRAAGAEQGIKIGKDGRSVGALYGKALQRSRGAGGSGGRDRGGGRNELKSSHEIAKERMAKERRRKKNGRPSKGQGNGRGSGGSRGRSRA